MRRSSATSSLTSAPTDESKFLKDDTELASALSGVFVLPLVELEAALNEDRPPFLHILAKRFGLFSEGVHIDESGLVLLLSFGVPPHAVDGEAQLGHRGALGGVAQFRIPGQVAHQDDFVEACHVGRLSGCAVKNQSV